MGQKDWYLKKNKKFYINKRCCIIRYYSLKLIYLIEYDEISLLKFFLLYHNLLKKQNNILLICNKKSMITNVYNYFFKANSLKKDHKPLKLRK